MLECSHLSTRALVVVSPSGKTLFWIRSHATVRIILLHITAVELAALHLEPAVDPPRWVADFATVCWGPWKF